MITGSVTLNPYWFGIAILAGLLSFLSPCVLALVPAYLGYLGGRTARAGDAERNRWETFTHGLAFVLGFTFVFIVGGAAVGAVGSLLGNFMVKRWIARIGGAIVILFGLHTMGLITIPFLDTDTRRQYQPDARLGYVSSFLMGIFFSAGWAPCIGPVLGGVLNLALVLGEVGQGVVLLTAYSLGMAIPFLLAALGIGRVAELLRRHTRAIRITSVVTGVLLVGVGIMLMTGTLETLARYSSFLPTLGL